MPYHAPPLSHWFGLYLKTLVVEIPVYILLVRGVVTARRAALAAILCSTLTHPLLIYVWLPSFANRRTAITTGELLVCLIETVVFYAAARPVSWSRAAATAFIANGASYGAGVLTRVLRTMF